MLFWSALALALPHPTDSLPVSDSDLAGLQIIVGGEIETPLTGSLQEQSKKHTLAFKDDGVAPDVAANDGIWVAHTTVNQKGGDAPLLITAGNSELWNEPIPIGQVREQMFLKILLKQGKPIVKVDTFDSDAPPPDEAAPPPEEALVPTPQPDAPAVPQEVQTKTPTPTVNPPPTAKPSAPFYESNTLLKTLSALIFLGLGFIAGDRFRQWKPTQPLRWLYLGHGKNPPSQGQTLLLGQRQCWSCSEDINRQVLLHQFAKDLQGAGPVLLIVHPDRHAAVAQSLMGQAGIFISTEIPTSLEEIQVQVEHLRRLGNPIVLIDDLAALEKPQPNEPQEAVLQDVLYWLPEGCSILALVSPNYSGIIQHALTSVAWPNISTTQTPQSSSIPTVQTGPPSDSTVEK